MQSLWMLLSAYSCCVTRSTRKEAARCIFIGSFSGALSRLVPFASAEIQAEVIENHAWMTMPHFIDIFTISQMTPGPIGINAATFVGTKVAGLPGAVAATVGFVFPSVFIVLALAKLFFKYGDIGPIRGILNGLRPAVVALICSAGLSFVMLALWNTETLPKDFTKVDLLGCIVLPISLWCIRHKMSVIRTLCMSGVLGLILGIAGIR